MRENNSNNKNIQYGRLGQEWHQKFIDYMNFILHNDSSGSMIFLSLLASAKEGDGLNLRNANGHFQVSFTTLQNKNINTHWKNYK